MDDEGQGSMEGDLHGVGNLLGEFTVLRILRQSDDVFEMANAGLGIFIRGKVR